jgi:hypothetical protein
MLSCLSPFTVAEASVVTQGDPVVEAGRDVVRVGRPGTVVEFCNHFVSEGLTAFLDRLILVEFAEEELGPLVTAVIQWVQVATVGDQF